MTHSKCGYTFLQLNRRTQYNIVPPMRLREDVRVESYGAFSYCSYEGLRDDLPS
jgi:hypothetical protein